MIWILILMMISMAMVIVLCIDEIRTLRKDIKQCKNDIVEARHAVFNQKKKLDEQAALLEERAEIQKDELRKLQFSLLDTQNKYIAAKRRLEVYAREKLEEINNEQSI